MEARTDDATHRTLQADDGTALSVRDWPVEASPRAGTVLVMHGLGEHGDRYAHVARFFNERGWWVRTYDHRGHGKSGGPRGDVPDSEALLRDAKVVMDDLVRRTGDTPLLLGHSMGGLFAARYATAHLSPLRGLILSSPALALPLSGVQKALLGMLRRLAPGLGVNNGLKTRYLSHDPAVVSAYEKDPLVHSKISSRLLGAMVESVAFAQSHAGSLSLPTLMVVASDDRLVDASGSDAFYSNLAPGVGTIHRYPGFYHEIFNEIEAQRVFDHIDTWLRTLAGSAARAA